MGVAFIQAVHAGGQVIRKKLKNGKYITLAKSGGRWIVGKIKKVKRDE
jgi:hypothetical protein